jgi:hypothetical protein
MRAPRGQAARGAHRAAPDACLRRLAARAADAWVGARWNLAVTTVEPLPGTPGHHVMRRELPTDVAINEIAIAARRPAEMTLRTITGPTPFAYRYTFEPTSTGTRITLRAEMEPSGIARLAGPLAAQGRGAASTPTSAACATSWNREEHHRTEGRRLSRHPRERTRRFARCSRTEGASASIASPEPRSRPSRPGTTRRRRRSADAATRPTCPALRRPAVRGPLRRRLYRARSRGDVLRPSRVTPDPLTRPAPLRSILELRSPQTRSFAR